MKESRKAVPVPQPRGQTIRQEIIELLKLRPYSISELSKSAGKAEKEIVDQLTHIRKSSNLVIEPSRCINCDFVFIKRDRLKKPGKCPKCHGVRITEPKFAIE